MSPRTEEEVEVIRYAHRFIPLFLTSQDEGPSSTAPPQALGTSTLLGHRTQPPWERWFVRHFRRRMFLSLMKNTNTNSQGSIPRSQGLFLWGVALIYWGFSLHPGNAPSPWPFCLMHLMWGDSDCTLINSPTFILEGWLASADDNGQFCPIPSLTDRLMCFTKILCFTSTSFLDDLFSSNCTSVVPRHALFPSQGPHKDM